MILRPIFPNCFVPLFSLFTKIISSLFLPLFYLLSSHASFVLSFLKADDTNDVTNKDQKTSKQTRRRYTILKATYAKSRQSAHLLGLTLKMTKNRATNTPNSTTPAISEITYPSTFSRHAVSECHKPFRWTARIDFEVRLKSLRNETK